MLVRVAAAVRSPPAPSALVFYIFPGFSSRQWRTRADRRVCVVYLLAGPTRLLFERIVDEDLFKRRVLVYGAGRRAASLLELRRRSDSAASGCWDSSPPRATGSRPRRPAH